MNINVRAFNNNNEEILCHCGEPSGFMIMGMGGFIARCSEHNEFLPKEQAKFVYNPDAPNIAEVPRISKDFWIFDAKNSDEEIK